MELIPDVARTVAATRFTGRGEKEWWNPFSITSCSSVPTDATIATSVTFAFARKRISRAHPRNGRDTRRRFPGTFERPPTVVVVLGRERSKANAQAPLNGLRRTMGA